MALFSLPTQRIKAYCYEGGSFSPQEDQVAVEEPLEIRLCMFRGQGVVCYPMSITMRTPGHDFELSAGFLFTEGILQSPKEIDCITYCCLAESTEAERGNIVNVYLRPGVEIDPERFRRNFYTTSSCGVCGKASIEALRSRKIQPCNKRVSLSPEVLCSLPPKMQSAQKVFASTGGLHAAGLFNAEGELLCLREDVGRHNAVDKLVGTLLLEERIGKEGDLLLVSGRPSFEIVQKAVCAGIPIVAGISAPSSLAIALAEEMQVTLIGFLRRNRFKLYTYPERIAFSSFPFGGDITPHQDK